MKHFIPIILVLSLVLFTGCGNRGGNRELNVGNYSPEQNEQPDQSVQRGILLDDTQSLGWQGDTSNEVAEAPATQNRTTADAPGFNLYGKTIGNEDFDWASLRGKYVLVKFTATWCPPCEAAIPGMLRLYERYNDKGLEIVSVYVFQREADPVTTVRNYVEGKGLPWIILSEELTTRAGQPPQGRTFGISGVPTFFLLDREGEILVDRTHSVGDIPPALARVLGE